MTTEEQKIYSGKLFRPGDQELKDLKLKAHRLNQDYNRLYEEDAEARQAILQELLGSIGEGTFLQGPITFHYGSHTRIGKNTFINFNLTIQDDGPVTIGDHCSFGPNVTIVTPCHPMLPQERKGIPNAQGELCHVCWAKGVTIGNDCWLGANVTVCPGVTIGDGVVIGAGSVVTHDIPSHTVAAGVPCRVLRELTEQDSLAFHPEFACTEYPLDNLAQATEETVKTPW